jgi:hypothetical protein
MSVKEISSSNPSGSKHGPNVTAANRKTSPVEIAATSSNPERSALTIALNQATSPKEENLTEDQIIEAARKFFGENGRLPTAKEKDKNKDKEVPGMLHVTWSGIDRAARKKGRTLFQILEPLRNEFRIVSARDKENLTEDQIIEAARKFYKKYHRLPTADKKDKNKEVPGMPDETWPGINAAGRYGGRGLNKGRTLSKILKPLKKELYGLTEDKIIKMAKEFYKINGRWPTCMDRGKGAVPGMPHTTWQNINRAGHDGKNGLKKGRTLTEILKPLKEKLDGIKLTRKGIPKIFKNANPNTVRKTKNKNPSSNKEVYSSLSIDKSRNVNFLKGEAFEQAVGLLLLSKSPEERVIPQYCIKVDPGNKYYGMRADYKVGEYYYEVKWGGATDNINETAEKHKKALGENQANYKMILLNANDGVRRHKYDLFSKLNNTVRTSEQLTNLVNYIEKLTDDNNALELEQLRDYLYGLVMKANTLKSEKRLDFIEKELSDYFSALDKAQYVSDHLYSLYSPLEAYFDYNGSLCRGLITPKALIEEKPEGYGLNCVFGDFSFEDPKDLDLAIKLEMGYYKDQNYAIEDLLEDKDRKHYDKVIFKLPDGADGITISYHSDLNPKIWLKNPDDVREIQNFKFKEGDYKFAERYSKFEFVLAS